jgi:hypothetical protein
MIGTTNVVNKKRSEVERINLTLQTNQASHTDLNGANFTISYGSYSKNYIWGGTTLTIEIPAHIEYSIHFGDVNGYATPSDLNYTAQAGNSRNVTPKYQTEVVSVTLSADNSQSVNGQIVTINGTKHTWNGATIIQKVAFGTKYTVSVNDKEGYTKPADQTFTANQASRNVLMKYEEIKLGVFIQATDGSLIKASEWNGSKTPNGVALLTDKCSLVMARKPLSDKYEFGGKGTIMEGVFSGNYSSAIKDYNGINNTKNMTSLPAANACYVYRFPNGKNGYLGAAGEWFYINENRAEIFEAFSKLGNPVPDEGVYWTSSQVWENDAYAGYFSTSFVTVSDVPKDFAIPVWPFTTL